MFAFPFRRAVLAAVLGLGVWAGLARAQDSVIIAPPPGPPPPPTGPWVGEETPPAPMKKRPAPLMDVLHLRCPRGCYANFNDYTCSSLKSECAYIFGSCRIFFGEPCFTGAPPSLLPGGVGGVGAPAGGCGCR
jgi:hypothetical protein